MPELRAIQIQLASIGVRGMLSVALRNRLGGPIGIWPLVEERLTGRSGLEIGGPSAVFSRRGLAPVYTVLAALDNCNFASETMWHGSAADGSPYQWDEEKPAGTHLVRDGTDLTGIADASYDVVLSSHALEHIANPLRALAEWARVVGPRGHLLLVVPHVEHTFDRRRPLTSLEHLEEDYERGIGEDDDTHLAEFVELMDFDLEPTGISRTAFRERSLDFVRNRAVHHHVFDTRLVLRLLDRAGYRILGVDTALPFHIVALARAPSTEGTGENEVFLARDAEWARRSVFRRDRAAT